MKTFAQTHYKIVTIFLFVLTLTILSGGKAHAASITVNTDTNPSLCTLDEAITNINDQTRTNTDCVETGGYGSEDTINIPGGTVLLTANLPQITGPATITGAGMGATTIDGDGGVYEVFRGGGADLSVKNLTISGFRNAALQFTGLNVIKVSSVEIDGTSSQPSSSFAHGGLLTAAPTVTIDNTYVHGISASGLSFSVYGIVLQATQGLTSNISISNTTIQNISSQDTSVVGISLATGLIDGSLTPGYINLDIQNTTISNLNGGNAGVMGIVSLPAVSSGNSEVNISALNNTISSLRGGSGGAFGSAHAVFLTGAALGAQDTTTSTFAGANNILESSQFSCTSNYDAAPIIGAGTSGGTVANIFSSNGGNLSSDSTCNPYFTKPSDQNNLTNLALTLGPLSDNGGFIPTIPLLEGSPAIDSGVTMAGLTSDARGVIRPQGTAYDSGAYESPYTKSVASLASTGQNSTLFIVMAISMLTLATGVVVFKKQHSI